ncbi:hypothetical protein LA080_011619 [Diaporthe eres]|nr:hypothetical protein LA080_011619 [Diaporthe eres]
MTSEEQPQEPCTACSWTQEHQQECLYKSHVNIFYERSSRGVWGLGSQYVVKDRKNRPPDLEPENTDFLRGATTIPMPLVLDAWDEEDDTAIRIIKRIDGEPLNKAWPGLTELQRREIAQETAAYLAQLRHLQSSRLHCLGKAGHLYAAFLFLGSGYDDLRGPFDSDDQLWAEMAKCLAGLPDKKVTGIIDWERSGYLLIWWEFVCTHHAEDAGDREWKAVRREYIEPHREAADFWRDLYNLSRYPNLDATGQEYLEELEAADE